MEFAKSSLFDVVIDDKPIFTATRYMIKDSILYIQFYVSESVEDIDDLIEANKIVITQYARTGVPLYRNICVVDEAQFYASSGDYNDLNTPAQFVFEYILDNEQSQMETV